MIRQDVRHQQLGLHRRSLERATRIPADIDPILDVQPPTNELDTAMVVPSQGSLALALRACP